ncbi:predicted protein [Nematostella vectensis]|uniref:DUF985 domain-containing protein n=1 Tax=Nematostella vectensis TaxID=45351 RepID=A7T3J3_NEMVE|nr:predicted protein [Nematostella vectensis]|eukprot:XP_001621570.1 hypothetical protein NEMVEDRAFT_v1g221823 [Nematostella vectensis]
MADGKNRKDILAEKLKLTPLSEEGGYFSETYRSVETIDTERKGKSRNLLTLIYYLIAQDFGGRNYLHQNKSDIAHFFHEGWPIEYTLVSPDGKIEKHILGRDVSKGQEPQLIVKVIQS